MANNTDIKPHIFLGSIGKVEKYTHPGSGGGDTVIPERNRQQHGGQLSAQLDQVKQQQQEIEAESEGYDLESGIGIQVAFESFPDVEMAVESLANATQGVELLNVNRNEEQILATIFVPEGKLTVIEKKLQSYLDYKQDKNGKPIDNRKLIDAIRSLRAAALDSLWTDDRDQLPQDADELFWWEVWLPVQDDRQAIIHDFKLLAEGANIQVSEHILEFPERSILLAKGSQSQFSNSSLLLSKISELRRAKETAAFFDELPPDQQVEWTDELLSRLQINNENPPYICILDTGTNIAHPLVSPFIEQIDQYSVNPNWSPNDDDGHGTGMAGLAIWGDLTEPLSSTAQIDVNFRCESVKVLRHFGDNEGKHLGIITSDGISLPEISNHDRTRVFAMALSSTDGRDRGRPSAWSSTVDSLAVDYLGDNQNPRFIAVAAGNTGTDLTALAGYPTYNEIQDIHDPGQSWNALTVGAYTQKTNITEADANQYSPLAPHNGLSPYSTTSVLWSKPMPIKPEIVFEGGNVGIDNHGCSGLPSLKLLTAHHDFLQRHFSTFDGTSAATALASKFSAEIYAHYPSLWPETVRALLVHSAQWTDAMKQQFSQGTTARQKAQNRVRRVGFGVPVLENALWSMNNSLALIVEDELQPFEKKQGKPPSTCDMHLHDLPWPKESLQALGEAPVEMTVTLSYFIEPNPSSRNVSGKYSYPSHQLRFDVRRPTETISDFQKRISRDARDVEEGTTRAPGDPDWLLGEFRHRGSIHKDVWSGSAAALAERGHIAVYPAMGWWRTRTKLQKWEKKARYSLVVSISTPEVEVDLYTEITNQIETSTAVTTEIQV